MVDVLHEKYAKIMREIDAIEEEIERYEKREGIPEDIMDNDEMNEDINILREKLTEKRNELSRLSDGCGKPHPR